MNPHEISRLQANVCPWIKTVGLRYSCPTGRYEVPLSVVVRDSLGKHPRLSYRNPSSTIKVWTTWSNITHRYQGAIYAECKMPADSVIHSAPVSRRKAHPLRRGREKSCLRLFAACFYRLCYFLEVLRIACRKVREPGELADLVGNIRSTSASLSQDTSLNACHDGAEAK